MTPRIVFTVLLAAAVGTVCTCGFAESPPPTPLVPEAASPSKAGMYATLGFGPPDETEHLQGHSPRFAFTVGVALPVKAWAYVDVGMYASMASYHAEPSLTGWGNDAHVRAFAVTGSGRVGHTGKKAAVFASAGLGFAYASLSGTEFYGFSSPPVDSTLAPVLTVAGSFEAPARKRSRFLAEARYSWIEADFGSYSGGSLNAGGPALLLGWKRVF